MFAPSVRRRRAAAAAATSFVTPYYFATALLVFVCLVYLLDPFSAFANVSPSLRCAACRRQRTRDAKSCTRCSENKVRGRGLLLSEGFGDPDREEIARRQVESARQRFPSVPSALFSTAVPVVELRSFSKDSPDRSLLLSETFVKASLNSCWDGQRCSEDMLGLVLSRGVRFVDLEIYLANLPNAGGVSLMVSVGALGSNANTGLVRGQTVDEDILPLSRVLDFLSTHAFNTTGSPCSDDPLFLHLRLHIPANDASRRRACELLIDALDRSLPARVSASEYLTMPVDRWSRKTAVILDVLSAPWLASRAAQLEVVDALRSRAAAFSGTDVAPIFTPRSTPADAARYATRALDCTGLAMPTEIYDESITGAVGRVFKQMLLGASAASDPCSLDDMRTLAAVSFLATPYYLTGGSGAVADVEAFFNRQGMAVVPKSAVMAEFL